MIKKGTVFYGNVTNSISVVDSIEFPVDSVFPDTVVFNFTKNGKKKKVITNFSNLVKMLSESLNDDSLIILGDLEG